MKFIHNLKEPLIKHIFAKLPTNATSLNFLFGTYLSCSSVLINQKIINRCVLDISFCCIRQEYVPTLKMYLNSSNIKL